MLGAGTAMVYPTLLAAIGDVDHPAWRARSVGVYRLWRDGGFAVGAVLAGAIADAFGILAAIWAVAVLTAASGLVVAVRMYETRPPTRPERDRRAVGRQGRSPGPARLLRRMARSAPSLKATLDIGRPCQAQLLQSRRRQAGLMTLIAYHDDVLTQLRRTGVAVPARGIQPPFRTFRPITSAWWPRGGQSTRACRA